MNRDHVRSARLQDRLTDEHRAWYRIRNADDGDTAVIVIYDEIGWFGVTATDFVSELRDITAARIELHINSPGGDVWDGVAIYNALIDHPATVLVVVDALAASAASFIAQAGDRVVMGRNAEMMIHDAFGLCIGNADDMRDMATRLDQASDNIASIYADRAGNGGVKTWRARMAEESWYSAQEAVDAGLADEVQKTRRRGAEQPEARWDLSIFQHAGRAHAPAPDIGQPDARRRATAPAPPEGRPTSTAAPVHHTATAEGTWDAGQNEGRLPSPMTLATAKAMYGWYDQDQVDGGEITKSACKLPHHNVADGGTPGAANLAGVRNALSRLPQSDIPEGEQEAVRSHLQAHLDDADTSSDTGDKAEPGPMAWLADVDLDDLPGTDSAVELKAMHRAFIDAADDVDLVDDQVTAGLREALEDFAYTPDVLRASLLDALEHPDPPPDPAEVATPLPTSIPIDLFIDATREALTNGT